jgi:hypothetical protein
MLTQRWSWLLIILAGMLTHTPAHAVLEDDRLDEKVNRSHLIDDDRFGLPTGSAEELFLERLKTIHTKEIGEGVGKQLKREDLDLFRQNQSAVEEFLKKFKFSDYPDLQKKFAGREKELEKFIQSMDVQQFLKYAQEAQGIHSGLEAGSVQPGATTPTPATPPTEEPPQPSGSPSESESKSQEGTASEAGSGDQPANSVLGRWLLKAADRFKDLDPELRNSPALRKIVRELSGKLDGTDERWKQLDEGANALAKKWTSLGETLPLDRLLPERGFSWPRGLTGESWPKWRSPESEPQPGGSSHLPRPGMPDLTGADGWRALWMLVILTALGLILWKTVRRAPAPGAGEAAVWQLGPWPVDPTAVQTRAELIQAFEYLSVLRLGRVARHWHHWTIASGLGQSPGDAVSAIRRGNPPDQRRRAAEQLALLYERARYAPPAESLPEAALATARRDLCLLAGVPLL